MFDFVVHLGDLTQNGQHTYEWDRADAAMSLLDQANIPYGTAVGNHDYGEWPSVDDTNYLQYFGPQRFHGKQWYGGASPTGLSNYQLIDFGDTGFVFLQLCYTTPLSELEWASEVLTLHKDRLAFVSTHKYTMDLRVSVGRHGEVMKSGLLRGIPVPEASDQREYPDTIMSHEFYEGFVQQHANIVMVFAGHFCANHFRQDGFNGADLPIVEVITDFQCSRNGGDGYMRIVEVDLPQQQIHSYVYSSFYERERTILDDLVEDIALLLQYAVNGVRDALGEEIAAFVERFLLGAWKDDVVPFYNVIANHPEYLANGDWYEQLWKDQYLDGMPAAYQSRVTDWEGLWMMVFASNRNRPRDYDDDKQSSSSRSSTFTLSLPLRDYTRLPVRAGGKSLQRRLREALVWNQGRTDRRQQLALIGDLPRLSPADRALWESLNMTEVIQQSLAKAWMD